MAKSNSEVRRPRGRVKGKIVVVFLILALIAGAFLFGLSRGVKADDSPVITADLLGQQLRDIQELATSEYYYTNMGRFENSLDFYGWQVPFTSKSFIVSYDGIIKAGVNLSSVRVRVDDAAKTVTVTLPESAILSHEIPEDSIEVFDESDGLFNHITIEDYTGFTADQKAVIEQKAIGNGLLTAASEKARDAVYSLLSVMPGMEEYTLTVK